MVESLGSPHRRERDVHVRERASIPRETKVGLFVLVGLVVGAIAVFFIDGERRLLVSHVTFQTSFGDVQGLKEDAVVRINGLDAGRVTWVGHAEDPSDPRVYVRMSIIRSAASILKSDASARIANMGLLGDKLVEVSPGTGAPRPISDVIIRGTESKSFATMLEEFGAIARKAESLSSDVDQMSRSLNDDDFRRDMMSAVQSARTIRMHLVEGNGLAHRLLEDSTVSDRISRTVANFERTQVELAQTATEIRHTTERINHGPGFAHDLLHSGVGSRTLGQLDAAAGEVELTMTGVREGNGFWKGGVQGGGVLREFLGNLEATRSDARDVVASVRAGRGTLGGLWVDPSVYEDIRGVLGSVQRRDVFHALVRYSVKRDEQESTVHPPVPKARGK
jgi:phospholipid/cholesterol/gamma-HCH transport system substrate-binding protein